MSTSATPSTRADEGYLLLADISGFTAFMAAVGVAHGVDFSSGIPPGFALMGALLDSVAAGFVAPFSVVQLEGDAVFGVAPSRELDGRGNALVGDLRDVYARFRARRDEAFRVASAGHVCTACPLVSALDLKMVLHQGTYVRQTVYGQPGLLGPAVNVAHRLLKNTVAEQVGHRHYLLLTDAAAARLGLATAGFRHVESYPDVGDVSARVVDLVMPA